MSIEFHTELKGDTIEIPETVRKYVAIGKRVKVVITEEPARKSQNYLRELLEQPLEVADFKAMTRDEIHERGNG